ncbi:MAG: glycosyltransferase family 39 protein [SAR324 cluster bacterium]|nr:glycosyltransferase family 39 protein [SAR324 cluster bacterium]
MRTIIDEQNLLRVLHFCKIYLSIPAIILLGLILRLVLFSGDGLGDDPNYFVSFKVLFDGHFQKWAMYHHRFSYWILLLGVWKLFGMSEFTFILPILLSSLGCILLTYLIGKELLDKATGIIAALLLAVQPFEVFTSTLMATDVTLSFYFLISVYFFILGQKKEQIKFFIWSALFAYLAYINKPIGLFILPVFGLFYIHKHGLDFKKVKNYLPFIISLALFFGATFLICWLLFDDALLIFTSYGSETWLPLFDMRQLLTYPKQMFGPYIYGERFHGFHFYTVALCLLAVRASNRKITMLLFGWFLVLFCLINFMPHRIENGIPYAYSQRLFRFLIITIPPSTLFIAYFWNRLRVKNKYIFSLLFAAYLAFSVSWAYDASGVARIAFGEVRDATRFLMDLGNVEIYADRHVISKLERFWNNGESKGQWHEWDNVESPEEWKQKFLSVPEGYVVTGGPRNPYYGCFHCIPNLSDFEPPENWKLVKIFNTRQYPPWKLEPLRIWQVIYRGDETEIKIADPKLEDCLRKKTYPLRPQDGLSADQPITTRLSRKVDRIECDQSGVADISGLEAFQNITILNLSGGELTHLDLSPFPNLEMVLLAGNQILEIKGLNQLKKLRLFWLAGNKLTSLDLTGLSSLIDLRVDDNLLNQIEGSSTLRRLEVIFLGGNPDLKCEKLEFPKPKIKVHGCDDEP